MGNPEPRWTLENLQYTYIITCAGYLYRMLKNPPRARQRQDNKVCYNGNWYVCLKSSTNNEKGYHRIKIEGTTYSIHRLVASASTPAIRNSGTRASA